jgi:hypothetical protein
MEILHGIYIGVCTAWWGLVRLMVTQTKTSSKEPLDQCQLWSFLVRVCIHNHREGIKSLPLPLFWFLHRVGKLFRVFFIPKGALTGLLAIPIFRATRITKLMLTPGYETRKQNLVWRNSKPCYQSWTTEFYTEPNNLVHVHIQEQDTIILGKKWNNKGESLLQHQNQKSWFLLFTSPS